MNTFSRPLGKLMLLLIVTSLGTKSKVGAGEPAVMRVIARIFARPAGYPTTPATTQITTIGVGQDFVVKLLVQDIRNSPVGVFSAYVDVNFSEGLATLVQTLPGVTHPTSGDPTPYRHNTSEYGQRALPDTGDGLIDTDSNLIADQINLIGSFSGNLSGSGGGEIVLVEWAMTAANEGTLTISPEPGTEDPADDPNDDGDSPVFDARIFGQDESVCPSQSMADPCMGSIEFVADTLTITSGPVASAYRPDNHIGKKAGRQKGNGTYNANGAGQSQRVKMEGNKKGKFFFIAENDGSDPDGFRITGTPKNKKLKIKYFQLTGGRRNVTAAMTRGGYALAGVAPGAKLLFKTLVKGTPKVRGKRARRTFRVTTVSAGDGSLDQVAAKVKKKP